MKPFWYSLTGGLDVQHGFASSERSQGNFLAWEEYESGAMGQIVGFKLNQIIMERATAVEKYIFGSFGNGGCYELDLVSRKSAQECARGRKELG